MRDVKVINGNSPELYIDGKERCQYYTVSVIFRCRRNTAQAHIANLLPRIHLVTWMRPSHGLA